MRIECRMSNVECRMPNAECRISNVTQLLFEARAKKTVNADINKIALIGM